MLRRTLVSVSGFTVVLAGCAGRLAPVVVPSPPAVVAVPPAAMPTAPFITTFWCGPPLPLFDDERAAEIVAAGFTVVGPPCEGEQSPALARRALDVAGRHGLRLWLADARYSARAPEHPGWRDGLAAAVAEYRDHPALGGYFVTDEPAPHDFPAVAAVVRALCEADPDHFAYVNLLPAFAVPPAMAPSYRQYVEGFVDLVRPALLSYDEYVLLNGGRDRPTFFTSLALFRDVAARAGIPFMYIFQAMPHGPYRDPSEAELSWQAMHALAYGARGISYFAYWTPVNVEYQAQMRFRHGLIEHGRPTRHYHEAARVNAEVRAIAEVLAAYRSVEIIEVRRDTPTQISSGPMLSADGPLTVGVFEDEAGARAYLVVNRDYRRDVTVRLEDVDGRRLMQFDGETGRWSAVSGALVLKAGRAGTIGVAAP